MARAKTYGHGRPAARQADMPCTAAVARRAARQLTKIYDEALRPSGLKLTQYSVLVNVARAGDLSITELADRLVMDRTTLTRNLRPLEQAKWIRIAAGPDKRSRSVVITANGRRILAEAKPLWRAAERDFRRGMGRTESGDLHRLLERAIERSAD